MISWILQDLPKGRQGCSYAIVRMAMVESVVTTKSKETAPQGLKPTFNLELLRHD
jgi:hypothetical protein